METQYFLQATPASVQASGRDANAIRLPLGSEKWGWKFLFYGNEEITSWADWRQRIAEGGEIVDENGHPVAFEELCSIVERAQGLERTYVCPVRHALMGKTQWKDEEGYLFTRPDLV
ncbi:hypothetical protein [Pararhodospirillum oryzae]|uniref:Uncharacterized protein n=1 Tax=Pararhodospirillum oryzae TaxID=478448 RepID=A0A512H5D9_9PROT|nr:hypothetical protein [Pararhodospirillum oryzae]GEO80657.1 hypothetical protein ROR02_07880 [Pararhodospirillum oryzae]